MSRLSEIKISSPTTTDVIPTTGKKVKVRAFKVGDEKALLVAAQSQNDNEMVLTLKEVVSNCVEGDYDVNKLASADLEYLFIKLRAFSVGEISDLVFTCDSCEAENKVKVDITKIEIEKEQKDPIIKVDDNFGFKMKFSDLEDIVKAEDGNTDDYIELIARSIESIFYGDEIIEITDEEIPEVIRIINELTNKEFDKMLDFLKGQPKVVKDVKFDCVECEKHNERRLEGLANFF